MLVGLVWMDPAAYAVHDLLFLRMMCVAISLASFLLAGCGQIFPRIDLADTFTAVNSHLQHHCVVGIFPEGGSHDQTKMLPLKVRACVRTCACGTCVRTCVRTRVCVDVCSGGIPTVVGM